MLSRFLRRAFYRFARPIVKLSKDDDATRLMWLEDLRNQEVQKYIKKENRYTQLQLISAWQLQKQIRKRISQLENIEHHCSESIDNEEIVDSYIYYQKGTCDGLPSVYRKHIKLGGEILVFDQNEVAKETGFIQMLGLKISPCSKYVAAIVKTDVSDASCKCYVYRIDQHRPVLIEKLPNVKNAEWANNGTDLIITICDEFGVPREVKKYCIQKRKIYPLLQEKDPGFQFDILKSRDGKYIILHSNSKSCSEVHFMDSSKPECEFQCLLKREDEIQCLVDHWGNHFYALKNDRENIDYMICRTSWEDSTSSWDKVYSPTNKSSILDIEVLSDCVVAYELSNLIPQLTFVPFDHHENFRVVKASNHPSIVESFSNQNPYCESIRYAVSSPITPLQVFELNRSNLEPTQISRTPSNWNSADFECKVLETRSQDGTIVPTTIYYRRSLEDFDNAPLFATVYGAYGIPADLRFSATNAFLLENGWILAFPHVRGGGEFGHTWYKQATRQGKRKTFEDLAASVENLHRSGISKPSKTAVFGISAGGLAAAVICNEMPQHFQAAVLQVPFVDVLNSMVNGSSYLTQQEYEEWGNPVTSKDDFSIIESYCPLHNLKQAENFPSIYITTYIDDDRVPAWMPLKFMAEWRSLEAISPNLNSLVLCRIYESGGHYGYTNHQRSNSISEMITFLYMALRLNLNS